jgi:hypothetical protein
MYVLVDNDPWGYYIYSVLKQGPINLAFESERMAIPKAKFISAIWSFTEHLVFLSRLYERIAPDTTLRFAITLRGCNGRELAAFDPMVAFWEGHIAHEDVIRQAREVQVAEWRELHICRLPWKWSSTCSTSSIGWMLATPLSRPRSRS